MIFKNYMRGNQKEFHKIILCQIILIQNYLNLDIEKMYEILKDGR